MRKAKDRANKWGALPGTDRARITFGFIEEN